MGVRERKKIASKLHTKQTYTHTLARMCVCVCVYIYRMGNLRWSNFKVVDILLLISSMVDLERGHESLKIGKHIN